MYEKIVNPKTILHNSFSERITKRSVNEANKESNMNDNNMAANNMQKSKALKFELNLKKSDMNQTPAPMDLTQKKLEEAIIWSEILGEPMCKRRKRRLI